MGDPFGEFERAGWSAGRAAPYHHGLGDITGRAIEPLLDAAQVAAGSRVLDVATGPGYVAARAAARGAEVVAVDFSDEMLALAARVNPGPEYVHADAGELPFGDGEFDAVVAGFLMPHVSDLPAVVRELARVARGPVALTTWHSPERVACIGALLDAVAEAGARPPEDLPSGPPFFQYAAQADFAALLRGAGLREPRIETIEFTHPVTDVDSFWHDLVAGTVRMNALVTSQPPTVQAAMRAAYEARLEPYRTDAGFELPCAVQLGSARA